MFEVGWLGGFGGVVGDLLEERWWFWLWRGGGWEPVGGEMVVVVVVERWWVGSLAGEPLDGEPLDGEPVACVLGRQEVWEIR